MHEYRKMPRMINLIMMPSLKMKKIKICCLVCMYDCTHLEKKSKRVHIEPLVLIMSGGWSSVGWGRMGFILFTSCTSTLKNNVTSMNYRIPNFFYLKKEFNIWVSLVIGY